jgi:pantoate--beta-alanine ligase
MRTIRTVAELRAHLGDTPGSVGLVPTMGALHAGHESLIRAAREENDVVVVSLFVNPAQFNDPRDLEAYPRDERRDAEIAERHGADVLFAPAQDEVYRAGASTKVIVEGLGEVFEGAHRGPGPLRRRLHRRREAVQHGPAGPRLLRPEGRPAGRVLKRMVADLDFPLEIRVQPTVRDPDGLALSSRNARLSRRSAGGPSPSTPPCKPRRTAARGRRGGAGRARHRARVLRRRRPRDRSRRPAT